MFPSFTPFSVVRFGFGRSSKVVDLPSVEIHNIETSTEKRTRRFKHLLKLNHVNHAVLFNERKFHNHLPHVRLPEFFASGTSYVLLQFVPGIFLSYRLPMSFLMLRVLLVVTKPWIFSKLIAHFL